MDLGGVFGRKVEVQGYFHGVRAEGIDEALAWGFPLNEHSRKMGLIYPALEKSLRVESPPVRLYTPSKVGCPSKAIPIISEVLSQAPPKRLIF